MKSWYFAIPLSIVAMLLLTKLCFAQASEAEMANFPMPPPSGYVAEKTFAFVGDYGYYTAPMTSVHGLTHNSSDYKYARYSGVDGKNVYVYGAWGTTEIKAPQNAGDPCFYAHTSYGVWGKYEASLGPIIIGRGWNFLGGGGMSGSRDADGRCVFNPNDPRFGWGDTYKSFDLRPPTRCGGFICWKYTEIVVGALSSMDALGSCTVPRFQVAACFEPSYIIGYTLP
jgi:hypothetical protein